MGEADGMLFQAMELLEGADLGKVMAEGRHFTWDEQLAIMEQVCDGLQYAHEHHLVHRDIKPANLFLENSGRVRVLDFGMVRVAESELTKVGSSLGTLNYMSPEQIRGERCTPATRRVFRGHRLLSARHRPAPVFGARPQLGTGGQRHRVRDSAEALRTGARCARRPGVPSQSCARKGPGQRACRMPAN